MRKILFGSVAVTLLVLGVVIGILITTTMDVPTIVDKQVIQPREWKSIDTSHIPATGEGGVYWIHIYPHQAAPTVAYASNITNATSYAYGNFSGTLTGNVPYIGTYDIVIPCRYNVTQAYNTTGATWMNDWIHANLTCATLGIGANTTMSMRNIVNNSNYMWVNYYLNNGGAGYSISHGQTINVTYFKMCYYG